MKTSATRSAIRFCARIPAHISAACAASLLLLAAAPAAAQPVNDACANALPITLQTVTFDVSTATTDGPVNCSISRDIWYRFTPTRSGLYRATTCDGSSTADTVIVVSTDNCAAPALIGCNDQACGDRSRITFFAEVGVPVLIRVGLWSSATSSGAGSLTIANADSSPTAFTYQGRLERDGVPYTGSADVRFELTNSRDATGLAVTTDEVAGIQVVDGVFTTPVDFGDQFVQQTSPRFVRVRVRTNPADTFTPLIPTQPLSLTPYAALSTRAVSANSASTATSATNATNAVNAQSVPWTGITDIPPSLADNVDNEGPWTSVLGGTQFTGGRVIIGPDTTVARVSLFDAGDSNILFMQSDSSFGTTALMRSGNSNSTYAAIVTGTTGPFGSGNFVLRNVGANRDRLVIDPSGRFGIGTAPVDGRVINVNGGAHCTGTNWVNASSRDFKTDFQPLDHADILRKVTDLPITSWSYRRDHAPFADADPASPLARHIGPTAEDFADAFGLGADRTGISTVDQSGVALAAIQALAKENAELRARLDRLEKLLEAAAPAPAAPATTPMP